MTEDAKVRVRVIGSSRVIAAFLLGALVPMLALAADPCVASAKQKIHLSGQNPDIISVAISGPSCATATLVVRIMSASGSTLYESSTPLSHFYSVTGDPPYIDPPSISSAQRLAEEIVTSPVTRKVAELLPYFDGEHDDGINIRKFVLSKVAVMRLREQPCFALTTGWETWSELAFDPESSRVVVVAEGWL